MTFLEYGELWRLHRRIISQQLNPRAVSAFQPSQLRCTQELLHDMMRNPNDFWMKTHKYAAYTIAYLKAN